MSDLLFGEGKVTVTFFDQICLSKQADGTICGMPSEARYRVGCVHEHVREAPVCGFCAERLDQGMGNCRICLFEMDARHECRLVGRRLP